MSTDQQTDPYLSREPVSNGPRDLAIANEILRTVVGSGVHGLAIEGTDDHDEMSIYIEPREYVMGITSWHYPTQSEGHTGEGAPHYTARTVPEGMRSRPGDTDLSAYSLRKYVRLAAIGNPTVLLPLYAPHGDVLRITDLGMMLRDHRRLFLSQRAVHRFLAYAENQRERMMGGGTRNRVPKRPELVERHGWDTKYGSHALRVAMEGYEIALTGHLTLPMAQEQREVALSVKRGEMTRDDVNRMCLMYANATQQLLVLGTSALPPEPDWAAINDLMATMHMTAWGLREDER